VTRNSRSPHHAAHVLIAIAEVRQRHHAVDGLEHQVPALPIDALECHARQQLAHCLVDDREPFVLAAVVEVDRPRLQRVEHGVGRKERRDVVRAPMAERETAGCVDSLVLLSRRDAPYAMTR
jgi:hypothetical protein